MTRGFSLIEVLVASLLVLLVLVVVLTPIIRSRDSVSAARLRLEALRLADELMQQAPSSGQGMSVRAQGTFLYALHCHSVEPHLYRVDLEIRWERSSLRQQTYLYGVGP